MKMKISKVENAVQVPRKKHIPGRSCAACRKVKGKRELIRLVCSGGSVVVDLKGKQPGRGIYLCPAKECWESALKNDRIAYGLRTKMTDTNRQTLLEYGRGLQQVKDIS